MKKSRSKQTGSTHSTRKPIQQSRHKLKGVKQQHTKKPGKGAPAPANHLKLYGLHTVSAALANPARRKSLLNVSENSLKRLDEALLKRSEVEIRIYQPSALDAMLPAEAVHQGVILDCEPLDGIDASELFHLADKKLVLVLDQITDPHNVGAILRSAVAFDVAAVLITRRNSAVETAVLAKSASGALDMIPLVQIRNLSKSLDELANMGFATIGLDSEGPAILEETIKQHDIDKLALVLGSEGKGLRQQTRETCSHLARLDMPGKIKSLNVSNAAALSLYIAASNISR